jgi:hypothetical protein
MSLLRSKRWRWLLGGSAMAAAVAATLPDASSSPDVVAAPARGPVSAAPTSPAAAAAWPEPAPRRALLRREAPIGDAMAAWEPAPTPATPASAPARPALVGPTIPAPPAFGYTLIGRIEEDGDNKAVLNSELRTLAVRAGEVVDSQWRVDAVDATQVTLVWLPTQHKQILALPMR